MNELKFNKILFFFFRTIEGYRNENKDTSDDDSVESIKTGEQETTS